jgi:hypothetical protein
MAPTIEQLEAMNDEEVRAAYNEVSVNTVIGSRVVPGRASLACD